MPTIIIPPAVEPITLAQARAQCRVDADVTDEDDLLQLCIEDATEACEGLLRRPLIERTVERVLDLFPAQEIELAYGPVRSIVSVRYIDAAGVQQTLAPAAYVLDTADGVDWLLPAVGTSWPETDGNVSGVRIQYVAGYGPTGASIPRPVRRWLLLTVNHFFENRGVMDATGKVRELPSRFVDRLLDPYINYGNV